MGYGTGGSSGWTDVVGRGVGGALVREREAVRYEAVGRAACGAPSDLPDLDTLPDLARFRALDPAPDPFDIPDEFESLQAAVVTLAAHIHAADYRSLTYIAEFDRLGGWKLAGHLNCAEWLHFHTGIDKGATREWVRAARALPRLPLVSEAMSRGELERFVRSWRHVRRGDEGELERRRRLGPRGWVTGASHRGGHPPAAAR